MFSNLKYLTFNVSYKIDKIFLGNIWHGKARKNEAISWEIETITIFWEKKLRKFISATTATHKCNDWDNNKFVVQALGRMRF